jgi:DNA-binding CsgD family transcriptional regulator
VNASIFTPREHTIAHLLVEGAINREIADSIGTTEHMVKKYLLTMYDKSGMGSRLELALWYLYHFLLHD